MRGGGEEDGKAETRTSCDINMCVCVRVGAKGKGRLRHILDFIFWKIKTLDSQMKMKTKQGFSFFSHFNIQLKILEVYEMIRIQFFFSFLLQ